MTEYKFQGSQEMANTIRFYNTLDGQQTEVLRISTDGFTANPDVPVDEAADAVLRALDTYLKNMVAKALTAERERIASQIDRMPFGDTAASFAVWIRAGAP